MLVKRVYDDLLAGRMARSRNSLLNKNIKFSND